MVFEKDEKFFSGRLKSLKFATLGAFKLITTEHSVMTQSIIAASLVILGFYFQITRIEWIFQIFAIGLVLSIEGLNTAVEKTADFIHPDYHEKIGFIKDIAAGAVFFAALASKIVIIIIYYPYFIE
ncbi:MAG: diacylglycerol kinase family protein [Flavobacterium sp.]